jgi:putative PIN family toxin of toxin-antitoxin system
VRLRLVFDTNSIVSALLFEHGKLAWLRAFWRSDACKPLASKATVQELIRVLAYPKFKLEEQQIQALLADYLPFVESVELSGNTSGLPVCRDVNDQMFIELASIGKADVLVSGDADLLVLADACPFVIETPTDFHRRIHS